jgi:crossover junction endodeoxyribonuclease RuvC
MTTILGLDASSKTIGYGVIKIDGYKQILLAHGYLKPPKKGNIFIRLQKTKQMVLKIMEQYKPDIVGLEQIVSFMKGLSTAQTVIALASINRMVGLVATEYLGHPPLLCNVLAIRHKLKLTPVLPKKQDMPTLVAKHLGITFPYELSSAAKETEEDGDVADSIGVALYTIKYIQDLEQQILKLQSKNTTNKKQIRKFKKQLKEKQTEYKEITGNEYQGSL